jgi:hypothetical protein
LLREREQATAAKNLDRVRVIESELAWYGVRVRPGVSVPVERRV